MRQRALGGGVQPQQLSVWDEGTLGRAGEQTEARRALISGARPHETAMELLWHNR